MIDVLPRLLAALLALGCAAMPWAVGAQQGERDTTPSPVAPGGPTRLPEPLRDLRIPPAPVLSPEQALRSLRTATGFRVELVAAEPLVVDPVAVAWDAHGRLYAVEMRGFMPNIEGEGEDEPVGRVVVLEDTDADGRMDRSRVALDGLVLPRAVAAVEGGLLVGEPPNLWFCQDADDDGVCERKRRVGEYGDPAGNLEHIDNGLMWALDGWIYNAKSSLRYRFRDGELQVQPTAFRGQWGISQDDRGRLYTNNNSQFLAVDLYPSEFLQRHPLTRPARGLAIGLTVDLTPSEPVFPVRVNPGVTRGYRPGELRDDGRLARATAVSGVAVLRGDQYGPEYAGDVFVPEPGGNVVAQFRPRPAGIGMRVEHRLYPDPDWGEREFLASTDERFRPVNAAVGPDGALYVIDMYRGIVQHGFFISDYLRAQIEARGLDEPVGLGRIYRVVREGAPIRRAAPRLDRASTRQRVEALSHPAGWWRDTAQRLLVETPDPAALPLLRELSAHSPLGRVHALWTLRDLGGVDDATLLRALDDPDPEVRIAALRTGEERLAGPGRAALRDAYLARAQDPDAGVRLHAMFTLAAASDEPEVRAAMLALLHRESFGEAEGSEAHFRQALISGSAGRETLWLDDLGRDPEWRRESADGAALVSELARAAFVRLGEAEDPAAGISGLLDYIAEQPGNAESLWRKRAMLEGIVRVARAGGYEPVKLAGVHPLFDGGESSDPALRAALRAARQAVTWPGDERPAGPVAMSEAQLARMRAAEALYPVCGACHGPEGRGLPALAPALVGSPWVNDSDGWLIRIVLQGIEGPIEVAGERWDMAMPGHAADPALDDEALAGLLTLLRRSWGQKGAPVEPERVAEVRAATAGRRRPWTVEELLKEPVDHRLDAFVGRYQMDVMPVVMRVRREADRLLVSSMGQGEGPLDPDGDDGYRPRSDPLGTRFEFQQDERGKVTGLLIRMETGQRVLLRKVE